MAVIRLAFAAALVSLTIGQAAAHDGTRHALASEAPAAPAQAALPLNIGGPFALTDHTGKPRTDRDFRGRFMLVFFGYANCRSICPVGLRRMTAALDALGPDGANIQPLLIAVDADHDTPARLREAIVPIHPRLIGLTGSQAQLRAVAKAYQVESRQVSRAADGTPVFAHGSFIYLMRPDGKLAAIMPPVMGEEQMAGIIRRHVN